MSASRPCEPPPNPTQCAHAAPPRSANIQRASGRQSALQDASKAQSPSPAPADRDGSANAARTSVVQQCDAEKHAVHSYLSPKQSRIFLGNNDRLTTHSAAPPSAQSAQHAAPAA